MVPPSDEEKGRPATDALSSDQDPAAARPAAILTYVGDSFPRQRRRRRVGCACGCLTKRPYFVDPECTLVRNASCPGLATAAAP
jgi:hypothetical protein